MQNADSNQDTFHLNKHCSRPKTVIRALSCGCCNVCCALQVKGVIKVSEFSSIDPDEYNFEVTVDAPDDATAAAANLKTAVHGLQGQILDCLQRFVTELNSL